MNDDWTNLEEVLGQLSRANPDTARAQRVREKCRRKLKPSQRLAAVARRAKAGALEAAVVGAFCAVYISLLTLIALHSHGVL